MSTSCRRPGAGVERYGELGVARGRPRSESRVELDAGPGGQQGRPGAGGVGDEGAACAGRGSSAAASSSAAAPADRRPARRRRRPASARAACAAPRAARRSGPAALRPGRAPAPAGSADHGSTRATAAAALHRGQRVGADRPTSRACGSAGAWPRAGSSRAAAPRIGIRTVHLTGRSTLHANAAASGASANCSGRPTREEGSRVPTVQAAQTGPRREARAGLVDRDRWSSTAPASAADPDPLPQPRAAAAAGPARSWSSTTSRTSTRSWSRR